MWCAPFLVMTHAPALSAIVLPLLICRRLGNGQVIDGLEAFAGCAFGGTSDDDCSVDLEAERKGAIQFWEVALAAL